MDRYDDRTPLWDYSDNRAPDDRPDRGRWDSARAEEAARTYVAAEDGERSRYGNRGRDERYGDRYSQRSYSRDDGRTAATAGNYGRVPRRDDSQAPAYSGYREPRGNYHADRGFRDYRGAQDERYAEDRGMRFWPSEFGFPPIGYSPYGDYGRAGRAGPAGRADDDRDHRGFIDRAGDEVLSWFGDRDARHRRELDHRGRGPKNYARSDDRIREDVNDRLTEDVWVDASEIEVSVTDGEVTLAGTVDDRRTKRRAEDCADAVSGVKHVQNNLRYTSGVVSPKID